ncbi:sugar phosphate isomerase/epimerase [Sphingomonas sp. BE270]|jgi:sugar phosphate isomerase/epimerase|uniref:sugar phosphate isomerase/epimerase family protein n=1 Tax=Sphingomonas sp. BE270 TaxID=2817726 RepID=UPI00285A7626|nr:TIM barrel protein [Sphingomonas sp. BE270]MDR7260051.1 sugar phosphate isomerase/epimerase [Sphingomonas sp. BE270]
MHHDLSLAFLTVFDAEPPEAVAIAADAGYDRVGLRLLPAASGERTYPLLTDKHVLSETLARLKDSHVRIGDVEIVRLKPDTDVAAFEPFLDRAAELGAANVLVAGDDPDPSRLRDRFAALCDLAAARELTADLEFMPWTAVKDLGAARAIVEAAGAPNGGVLIDALHFDRSATTLEDVKALPAPLIHYMQLCDGLADYDPSDEGLIKVARGERLLPGEGDIDLVWLLSAVPDGTPLSIETPNLALARRMGPRERAAQAIAAARRLLAKAGRA